MGLFSEFRDKLKVKTEDKRTSKYKYENINIREDKETGNLELYIEETISSSKEIKRPPQFSAAGFGGNMWESNPPGRFLAPHNGFEDRGTQPAPIYSHRPGYCSITG